MANGNQQRCCLIGTCCPPGSPEQRDALQKWLSAKIMGSPFGLDRNDREVGEAVSGWLDELPWEKGESHAG